MKYKRSAHQKCWLIDFGSTQVVKRRILEGRDFHLLAGPVTTINNKKPEFSSSFQLPKT
jgi:hypothetical protein